MRVLERLIVMEVGMGYEDLTYIKMYSEDGSFYYVSIGELSRLKSEFGAYLKTGENDLMYLVAPYGESFYIALSDIRSFIISDPVSRREFLEMEKQMKEEREANRADLGLGWEEEK